MANWTTVSSTVLEVGKPVRSIDITAIKENITAAFEKAAGAPVLANSYVVEAMLASSAVAQAKLKSTTGQVSTTETANLTLPGGSYGFYPTAGASNAGASPSHTARIMEAAAVGSESTNIWLDASASGGGTSSATQRYIQASPPYNIGNGDVPLFVFALLDTLGKVVATYVAPEPPWAYNGPTDIRADYYRGGKAFQRPRLTPAQRMQLRDQTRRDAVLEALGSAEDVEITHAIKNADMGLIPHPFMANDLAGLRVVLLDPVGAFCEGLATLHRHGESLATLLHGGSFAIDNVPLDAAAPAGVIAARTRWK